MGIAFSNIPTGPGIAYFPAFSVAYKEVLQVNFGNHAVKHQYPGYRAIQVSHIRNINGNQLMYFANARLSFY